ncbi:prepilin-type N-terminal cleavage/methylation domain-containing protein [Legionella fairfieldensis]|uniref:prepilin-type N-terminal cleavage/methylation domain-containing protein n=1 Tax=Legionella fairfieldensis TaxID=45064 RepID=UPI00056C9455|nr:type II secretion system protein [Legionella fairfieldensis]
MIKQHGFSLIEIVVSFLLISGIALTLLRQQLQLNQLMNQMLITSHRSIQKDNNKEQLFTTL